MRHTESDLRALLTEHSQERAGREPSAHLGAIVRRGRRMRRTRQAVTAGAAAVLAVAAVGVGNDLLTGAPRADRAAAAQPPTHSAQVEPGPKLPDSLPVRLGAEKSDLSLIHSQRFETMGVARTVSFTPTSSSTGFKVVCDDPRAWVVTVLRLRGGESGGGTARCGESAGAHHDRLSAPSDWLKRPQSVQVWVFPPDAPVQEVAKGATGCPKKAKQCDETARLLWRPEVRERLSAKLGELPGRWAVGVYDRPAGTGSGPGGEPSAATGSPVDGASATHH
ncbi:hypothetical protein [Nonomuraea pusilla]|uniref:Uncharacterized protein n=1 Tax=Nonomuraea pusilla TaxID=46177 RepID=A0A1H7Q8L7_9ACTN|nr:hypothetical protein [Nonomuraea pusilla]SEL43825.1 hypothetical protein SAMN05660976_02445 [Nonomuraea pusilla]